MTKRRRIALLGASVLAGVGLTVGGLAVANAGEARTIKVKWTAPAGMAYTGKVCTKATAHGVDRPFDEQCDTSVTVGEKGNITVPVPAEYEGRTVHVDIQSSVKGEGPIVWNDKTTDVIAESNAGDITTCFKWSGSASNPKVADAPLEECE